jgi:regulator of sigma E protease
LGTELILFGGIFGGVIDAIAWLLSPSNWWVILQVAGGLGFVIFVHELGHFLVAKACGVKCEKFYIGFDIGGMKLFKRQWGETEYGIGILPLGGYVKMLGQDDNPYRAADEMRRARATQDDDGENRPASAGAVANAPAHHLPSGDLPPEPTAEPHPPFDPRSYMAQSVPERMAIISAGVVMNVIFAFVMATVAYLIGVKELPCRISRVFPGGAAWEAGLESGDEVVRIKDLDNPKYDDLRTRVPLSDLQEGVEFVIRRQGVDKPFPVTIHPNADLGIPFIGVDGPRTLVVDDAVTQTYSAAARAYPPLLPGDRLQSVNGQKISTFKEWQQALVRFAKEPLKIGVLPAGAATESETASDDEKPDAAEAASAAPLNISVPTQARRDLGLIMKMGPVAAVRKDSPAARAGIKSGDVLMSLNGDPVGDPLTLSDRLQAVEKNVTLRIKRGDKELTFDLETAPVASVEEIGLTGRVGVPSLGISYQVFADIQEVEPDSPAADAGMQTGDVLKSVQFVLPPSLVEADRQLRQPDAIPITEENRDSWPVVLDALQSHHPRGTVRLSYLRDGRITTVELKPQESKEFFLADRGIHLSLDYRTREVAGILEASKLGFHKTVESLSMVYRFLQRLSQAQISPKMLGGPVTIARVAGKSAEEGFPALLMFLTMLSANLAVVNFLPIPVLDGGHMVFLIYEGIMGKPPSERVFVVLSYLGLAFILTLMLFVLGLDFGFISRQ